MSRLTLSRPRASWRNCAALRPMKSAKPRPRTGADWLGCRSSRLKIPMAFGKIGETLSALQLFDLVSADLEKVEREIGLESVASVEAINYINQYLQAGGGKRLRPFLVLLSGRMLGDANPMMIRIAAV